MKKIYQYVCLFLSVVAFSSCNDFLDVQPKGQLEQSKMFDDMMGFADAMFGIYAGDLYGEN